MSIRRQIADALRQAQKAQDRCTTATLRLVLAALKDLDIAARGQGAGEAVGDDKLLALLARMVRQREEAARQFRAGERPELAAREEAEIGVIARFLPRVLSEDEMESAVERAIGEVGATGLKDMGRVMAALKRDHPGRIDGARAGALVKRRLA